MSFNSNVCLVSVLRVWYLPGVSVIWTACLVPVLCFWYLHYASVTWYLYCLSGTCFVSCTRTVYVVPVRCAWYLKSVSDTLGLVKKTKRSQFHFLQGWISLLNKWRTFTLILKKNGVDSKTLKNRLTPYNPTFFWIKRG